MSESEGSKIHFRTKDRLTLEKEIIFQEYCGPLSLKYVCDYFGIPATQTEMARKTLYVPGEGTDTPEMINTLKEKGLFPLQISDLSLDVMDKMLGDKGLAIVYYSDREESFSGGSNPEHYYDPDGGHYAIYLGRTAPPENAAPGAVNTIHLLCPYRGFYTESEPNFVHYWADYIKDEENPEKIYKYKGYGLLVYPSLADKREAVEKLKQYIKEVK